MTEEASPSRAVVTEHDDDAQEVQRAKWRIYSRASYERHKEEKKRRVQEAYYRRTGRTPKQTSSLLVRQQLAAMNA